MADNKFLSKLSQNFLEILDDNQYHDITIEVGSNSHVKIFRAHVVILYYRSPYLRKILSTEKKHDVNNIKLPNILPEIFQIILRYIYGGKFSLDEYDNSDIVKILRAAGELNLEELTNHLQSFLIKNKSNWMEQNFNLIYRTSFEFDSLLELQKFCTKLISKEPEKIFKSHNFTSIPEESLISLIKSENISRINEVQIWEYVLKWGFNQTGLPSDPSNYSKENFTLLKNTLKKCILFIKFNNLSSKEFLDEVMPFKKIVPKDLYNDLLRKFLGSDNTGSINQPKGSASNFTTNFTTTTTDFCEQSTQPTDNNESIPLVCLVESIQEYRGSSGVLREKFEKLSEKYGSVRRCRRDGNSFYRAFGFALLERLMNSKGRNLCKSAFNSLTTARSILNSAGYQSSVYEDVYDIFKTQMGSVINGEYDEDMLLSNFQIDEISNSIVYCLRLITAAYLKLHHEEYEPFLEYEIEMDLFCTNFVETMGQGADNVHIVALSKALKVPIKVAYMNAKYDKSEIISYREFYDDDDNITSRPLEFLYRPSLHYDILYQKE